MRNWFNNTLKLRGKFVMAGLLILPFVMGLGAVGVWGVIDINSSVEDLYDDQFVSVLDITDTEQAVQDTQRQLRRAVAATTSASAGLAAGVSSENQDQDQNQSQSEKSLNAAAEQLKLARQSLDKYLQNDGQHPPEEQRLYEKVLAEWRVWEGQVNEVTRLVRLNNPAQRGQIAVLVGTDKSAEEDLVDALDAIIDYSKEEAEAAKSDAGQTFGLVITLVSILAGLAVVVFVTGMLFLGQAVTRPLVRLQKVTRLVSEGMLAARVGVAEAAQDEVAELSRAFNTLAAQLERSHQTSRAVSREVLVLSDQLSVTAQQQASANQEQVAAVSQVTIGLEELNETASEIAAATTQVVHSVVHSAHLTQQVAQASQQSHSVAGEGLGAVGQSLGRVEAVQGSLQLLGQELTGLSQLSKQISSVVDLIDSLADQTHLLALNASIEAAGEESYYEEYSGGGVGTGALAPAAFPSSVPGESLVPRPQKESDRAAQSIRGVRGARFGVIAREVKALADRSRQATEEVRGTIGQTQQKIEQAVRLAETSREETASALSSSQLAGSVISRLAETVTLNAQQVALISTTIAGVEARATQIQQAINQQRSANQQILTTMRSLTQISRDNSSAINQLSHTASAVNTQMYELNSLIEHVGTATVVV